MNKARRKAVELRRKLGLRGQVDAEGAANILGYEVIPWPMQVHQELRIDRYICVAEDLEPDWRRWMVAHAIGHIQMHPGNHLWIYKLRSSRPRRCAIPRHRRTLRPSESGPSDKRGWPEAACNAQVRFRPAPAGSLYLRGAAYICPPLGQSPHGASPHRALRPFSRGRPIPFGPRWRSYISP